MKTKIWVIVGDEEVLGAYFLESLALKALEGEGLSEARYNSLTIQESYVYDT